MKSTTKRSSSVRRARSFSNDRTPKVLATVEGRLRRIAKRRGTTKAKATYREAADLVHSLIGRGASA